MAVHFKFKSAKDFDSVAIDGHFISVGNLKEKIFELKHLGRGTDFDLVVTNAQTNEEYLEEEKLISKNTSVLIRRVPGRPRKPIVTAPATEQEEPLVKNTANDVQVVKDSFTGAEPSTAKYAEELDWDEFGNDLYAIPEALPVQSSIAAQEATPVSKEDEDSKLKALIDTPALDWQHQPSDGFGTGRGFGRGMGGRAMGGRGFGRGGFEKKTPPEGYICYRCKVPGHFIQHCPTNGDPNYDIKRVRPPTGIPKSMLMATPDGSYALPSGAVAVLKPNDAAFEKEIEGMPSTRSVGELPPELHCPLCKEVMKDAVLTSKCCFNSFCDKCIRDYIISRSICVCGASNILADDLLPNKTVRDTISRILESNDSSAENAGSAFQVQDMESRNPQAKVPSPTQSAASRGQQVLAQPPQREEASKIAVSVEENQAANDLQKQEARSKVPDVSEATHDSTRVKAAQGGTLMVDEERKQKPTSGDAGRKKKKKVHMPPGAAEMHWRAAQGLGPENYMMPMGPSAFDPYWNGIQPGFEGFMPPYPGPMPYMGGYGFGPMDVGFGSVLPQDPYGGPGFMLPYGPPPHRDLAELAMGFNAGPPMMSREEFEARKADLKRKREMERHGERHSSKDRDFGREVSSKVDVSPMKPKSKSIPIPSGAEHYQNPRHQLERRLSPDNRSRDPELPRPSSKKNPDYDHSYQDRHHHDEEDRRRRRHHHNDDDHHGHHHSSRGLQRRSESSAEPPAVVDRKHKATVPQPVRSMSPSDQLTAADKKHKASVFSRISFPDNKVVSSSSDVGRQKTAVPNGYYKGHKADLGSKRSSVAMATMDVDRDSSDDERHFKRRPSRYTSSPPPPPEMEESRPSRGSRDKDRDRDRGSYSKHR